MATVMIGALLSTVSLAAESLEPNVPIDPPGHICGPCLCSSSEALVDCSAHGLTAVPGEGLPLSAIHLDLRNNSVSFLQNGTFRHLTLLQQLDLSYNQMTSLAQGAFDGLQNVVFLNLSHNKLMLSSGGGESYFSGLQSLLYLDLSYNDLAHVDGGAFNGLRFSLSYLDLSHNHLSFEHENTAAWPLNDLNNLTHLDLSHNMFTALSRTMFKDGIQVLNLSFNIISYDELGFPSDAFERLNHSLTRMDISGNCKPRNVTYLPEYPDAALSALRNLQYLEMDGLVDKALGAGFKNLTKLAVLSFNSLNGGWCNMQVLRNQTFRNLYAGAVTELDLSRCGIKCIEPNALAPLRHSLKRLILSFNSLGFSAVNVALYGLQNSVLETLFIDSVVDRFSTCVFIAKNDTSNYRNTSISTIYARNNQLEMFCEEALQNMPRTLSAVYLYGNKLSFGRYIEDLQSLEGLHVLEVDGRAWAAYPPSYIPNMDLARCRASGSDGSLCDKASWGPTKHPLYRPNQGLPPGLEETPEEAEEHPTPPIYHLPPNLITFKSRYNQLFFRLQGLTFDSNNSLQYLYLECNLLTTWIGQIRGLEKVILLNLTSNLAYDIDVHFFRSFPSLQRLFLGRNYLREFIARDVNGDFFGPLKELNELDLSNNDINVIPRQLFRGNPNLQVLDLRENVLDIFDFNITHMPQLTHILLAYNSIKYLSGDVMQHLDTIAASSQESNSYMLDLTFNPLACTCEHMDFLSWIKSTQFELPKWGNYTCLMADGNYHHVNIFEAIDVVQASCVNNASILVGSLSCFFCLLVVLLSAVLYRFRWKLRYLYYASRLAYQRLDETRLQQFPYDAFVSYCSEDRLFVEQELTEELEMRVGLTLIVHNRDFTPGRPIPSNIVEAVQSSRRTLVVLTAELLQSEWCHYEMQMALMEGAYTGRDVLLFLIYRKVPANQIPREVLYNLQNSTYIEYPSSRDVALLRDFWSRLSQAIKQDA